MPRDVDHAEMSWSLASKADEKEFLGSLLKYVINNGSLMQTEEIILSIHVIGTNLDKCKCSLYVYRSRILNILQYFEIDRSAIYCLHDCNIFSSIQQ